MSKLKITQYRHIDIDHIADIHYVPLEDDEVVSIDMGQGPVPIRPPSSSLSIELKNGDPIQLQADEADRVWAEYQRALVAGDKTS
jgi:hypothetical protein